MKPSSQFWKGRRVFITGHTGFKGGWLAFWLTEMGADVHGFSLAPETDDNLFETIKLQRRLAGHTIGDIRDANQLLNAMQSSGAEVVFHLAAQPLVRYSYRNPVETYATNVMGTINLFEAVRQCASVQAVVNITTDKCYENREWLWGYRESEPLGGEDPYSSSKACAELVSSAYRNSFFAQSDVSMATVRAGNVIGGGDWAEDRLLPDFLRAIDNGETLTIRSPDAVRPWQHVLEPLSGYLILAQQLIEQGTPFARAWNFGPSDDDARTVEWVVKALMQLCPNNGWNIDKSAQPHEAHQLRLDSSMAKSLLGWRPQWDLSTALRQTVDWHQSWKQGEEMQSVTQAQIQDYQATM